MKQRKPKWKQIYETWHDRFLYFREDNYKGFLALGFLGVSFFILFVAVMAFGLLTDTTGMTHADIIWKGISIMLDGGNLSQDPSFLVTIILSLITVMSMICFSGGMVAFLSNMLSDHLEKVRDGDKEIRYQHFTLFLGWNDRALGLLKAFMLKEELNTVTDYVVILSELDGPELRERIQKQLGEYASHHKEAHLLRILVRNGDPADYASLLMVNYKNADEVFIFRDDEDMEPDYGVIRTFFSLMRAYEQQGQKLQNDRPDDCVDIVAEAITDETVELINRYRPRVPGIRSFRTEAFSTVRILARKYAEMVAGQDRVMLCHVNLVLPFLLEEMKKQAESAAGRIPKVTLLSDEDHANEAKALYEDSRFGEMWEQPPVLFREEMEQCDLLAAGLRNGYHRIFIMSDYIRAAAGRDHRSFGLWVYLADLVESDQTLMKAGEDRIIFEMQDETDAQIMEGFPFGQSIISADLIQEHMIGICKMQGLLPNR